MMPIYIKTTNACNLSCEHCFIAKADKADKRMMNTEQVGIIMDKLKTYYKYDMLQFNWYGGEPMMSGISFFNHILANYKDERIIHYLQTNLTLIYYRRQFFIYK
ncbi:MAG TPA: 4Fe-4S cluster-binding domain-containing protein, partial [Syntrophorhabdaceae bacterium]|nr:4Fe-4S cluster-binding domain-containing protein [Syntrophorhabdaceae bacterium]